MIDDDRSLDALKRALLIKRLQQRVAASAGGESALPPIARVERSGRLALSWSQQRLWFLDRLDSAASAAYHMAAGLELDGELDRGALRRALDGLVARHEVWRTRLVDGESGPYQAIDAADRGFALAEEDLRHLSGEAQVQAVDAISRREAQAPFDLACGPLVRGRLLRLSAQSHRLLVTQHHAISDGWSIGVIVRELAASYAAFVRGETDPLPELPIQYADYAQWQRDWLQGEVLATQLDYWRGALRGAPALLELPTDRSRPLQRSHAGAALPVELSRELSAQVRAFAQRQGVTVFMVLLSAWSVLLSRLSGQRDVVIGTPVANRRHPDTEGLIGFFVNTLALRVRLDETLDVAGLLEQIRSTTLEGYAHQDVPFEQVVEALNPPRTLSHSPVFQAMLGLNNTPGRQELALEGLSVRVAALDRTTAQFDLSLLLDDDGEVLAGQLEYATALFDAVRLDGWLAHWQVLLDALTRDATASVDRLAWLTAAQRHEVVETFNATAVNYPDESFVHGLFEAQAARTPDAVAVWFDDEVTTYAALDRQANRIAHRLIALGVQPDDRVAIAATRGVALVAGLLGILKSGAAYVPLDPQYPVERLAYMVEDCAPVALLVTTDVSTSFVDRILPTLVLDEALLEEGGANAPSVPALRRDHLAYVIYTSGSTGRPKGVMIEHGNVSNFIHWAHTAFPAALLQQTLACTSINFDLAVFELFAPLCRGGCVRLVADALQADSGLAGALLANTVPSALRAWLDAGHTLDGVAAVNVAGEPLKRDLVERLFATTAVTQLANLYGPSETTTYSTWQAMPRAGGFVAGIGKPIANTRIYLLDANGAPVPLGVAGEIHIGGAGVARGYLNQPALTAERFIADPFVAGGRLYKTGDLGRWLADGTIEYLGRNDFQVKLRGLRIELGEIEARLQAIEAIREAVVIARQDDGDTRLVAYLVAEGDAPSVSALRARLSTQLPEYMVPSAFVVLDALPLTPNGKLDRAALPEPGQDAVTQRSYVAPQDEREALLASLWQELLGRERVGRHDQFFELGGHSLLALRLVMRLQREFQVELALADVFAAPTLGDLAVSLQARRELPPLTAAPRDLPLPLTSAQQRLWFLDRLDPAASAAYHLAIALRLQGLLDVDALRAALADVVARHEVLRTRFVSVAGQPRQIVDTAAALPLAIDTLEASVDASIDAAVDARIALEAARAFDLENGPLIRATLLRRDAQDHVLILAQHHIVSDRWSADILAREIGIAYAALHRGDRPPLAPPALHYADYAVACERWRHSEAHARELAYWTAQLRDAPTLLELPLDRPRPATQNAAGAAVALELPPSLASGLRALAARHGCTVFMTLLAGWSALLSRLGGQHDIVTGVPFANRQRREVEGLLGFFVNTLALRVTLDDDPDVASLLQRVRATTLGAYAHAELPFESVVEALNPPRSRSHTPIVQTLLGLVSAQHETVPALADVQITPIEVPVVTTQFDLMLSLVDQGAAIGGQLIYRSELFDRISVERIGDGLLQVLRAMCADAGCRVSRLPLLADDEEGSVLIGATMPTPSWSAQVAFAAQARRRPEAIALRFAEGELAYAAIDERANRLAHHLLALGLRRGDRVALFLRRGPELVVALLAVLKAGAVYVPLDTRQPMARLGFLLGDCSPFAVLTEDALADDLPALALLRVIVVDDRSERAAIAARPAHEPDADADPAGEPVDAAYLIYTSGSTGKPKGVLVEQAGLSNYLQWAWNAYGDGATPVDALVSSPLAFDATVTSLWLPLISGGCARLLPEQDELGALESALRAGVRGLVKISPAHLQALGRRLDADGVRCAVDVFVIGGESLPASTVRLWRKLAPQARLINEYGPTETVVGCAVHDVSALPADAAGVPIGTPIANTAIVLLDRARQVVPRGVAGEIHIGGRGVARGYFGRDTLTRERFLDGIVVGGRAQRVYASGDLARLRNDGTLEFLGRNDFQLKLRGFRIEPGEIESRLEACSGIVEALVLARDERLVAYVVSDVPGGVDPAALRAQLAAQLPDYMLPAAFMELAAFPLTANGKIDRAALPSPDAASVASRRFEAPQTDAECVLARIWQDLLGLPQTGRQDQFFELGGHSLLVIALVERLRAAGWDLAVRSVFDAPVLADLALQLVRSATVADAGIGGIAPGMIADSGGIAQGTIRITPAMLPLTALTQAEIDRVVAATEGGAANVQDIYPLSPLQEGVLFHHLSAPDDDVYLLRSVLAFDAHVDLAAFLDALQRVVDRHDILRTAVHWQDLSAPVQVVLRRAAFPRHGLAAIDARDAADELLRLAAAPCRRLDLRRAPVLAAFVAEDRRAGRWLLALHYHHVAIDHITLELAVREIRLLLDGRDDALPVPQPYRDHIAACLAADRDAQAAFFRGLLGDVERTCTLFGLLPEAATERDEARRELDPAASMRVRAAARAAGVSAAVLFHVAWARVLSQCGAGDDVVFGTVLSGRLGGADQGRVLGMFVNTLPLRLRLDGLSAAGAVAAAYAALRDLLAHEQASLALAQRGAPLDPQSPLFTTLLNYRHSAASRTSDEARWRTLREDDRTSYAVTVSVDDLGDAFAAKVQCPCEPGAARVLDYLFTALDGLLDALADAPARGLATIAVVPEAERTALRALGAGESVPSSTMLAHELVEAQVRRTPDAIALEHGAERVRYAVLDAWAARIAQALQAQGVTAGAHVALLLPRGTAWVASLLGVLKCGAAYVPLDLQMPDRRMAELFDDCGATLVVTDAAREARVPEHARRLVLDPDWRDASPPSRPLPRAASPQHIAYVLYTSGSTGWPKAVAMPHSALVNLCQWHASAGSGLDAAERSLQFAAVGFDVAFQEVFTTLAAGACLVFAPDDVRADAAALVAFVAASRIERLFLPFVALDAFAQAAQTQMAALTALRTIVTAGEQLRLGPALRALVAAASGRRLHNHYGPTETHVVTAWQCTADAIDAADVLPPIGRPIANTQIHLLDGEGGPVPRGAVGEIHIGGAGVAWGYWNREALTAQRFVRDPFAAEPARLYRTGDLARWREDGALEFLGRNDFQVKLRGYRIEPGEVEARLSALDGVAQAVVVVHEERLVAYWTPAGAVVPSASQLRASLSEVLPDYLVPSAYVVLPGLPLTPNGKLDRRALPAPDATAVVRRGYEAPQGDLERQLAGIWSELLNLGRVGRQEHFFEVGGHSLLAVRLVSRVRQRLGVELALRTVFAQPVLSGMAAALREAAASALPPIARVERGGRLALSWSQQRLWFLDRLDSAASAAYHMAAGLELDGELDRGALRRALDGLVARHEVWRTRLVDGESGPYQAIDAADRGFALAEEDLRHLSGAAQVQAVDAISRREAQAPFDLACGPLVRGRLLRLSAQSHRLLVTQHHAISDGWSIGVIVRELAASYAAFVRGETDPLPELPIQYADYAQWQRDWLQGEVLATQLEYWRGALRGAPALLELPTDRSRPLQRSHAGAALPVELSRELSAQVRAFAQRQGVTVFMVLLSAWSVLLSRLSGQRDVVIGTPVANRRHPDTEGLIGFFVNTLALRVRLDETLDVAGLLEQIRSTTLEGYAHQDVPFEQVVEALNPPRTLSHSPVFQAMLGLNNTPGRQELALEGLSVRVAALDRTTAQFDLSLLLDDDGEVLAGQLEYATALFDAERLDGWLAHWQVLLDALTRDATASVDRLAWLTAAQRHEVVETFNATAVNYPDQPFVHGLFEAQAARTPDAVAVWFDGKETTYAALDRQANRIAHRLIALGVQPDDRVAIAATRGPALVAGLLGILKSGAAYVPLDPQYPVERLAYMVEDCAPVALLTTPDVSTGFVGRALPTLMLDAAMLEEGDANAPSAPALRRDHLAYVIYTSGSTGRPKGVMIEHAALANFLAAMKAELPLRAANALLAVTTVSFDIAALELFLPLAHGARIVLASALQAADAAWLRATLQTERIRWLQATPATWRLLLDSGWEGSTELTALCGGEALPRDLAARLLSRCAALWNMYGPTETTVWSCLRRVVSPGDAPIEAIGGPIANTRVYIVDAQGEPVPVGVSGEIQIAGDGVARGYFANAALTAERFVPEGFGKDATARRYRTGDLGRWRADGMIDYLGRNDFQLKLRGFRIEAGEIETQLEALSGVRRAVVALRDERLVAYVLPDPETSPAPAALRAALAQRLPAYMLPTAFVLVDAFAQTPNGKLDRAALPSPDRGAIAAPAYAAPHGDMELAVAALWQELLGLERVGRDDHFFDLGGHSLLAVQAVARLNERFGFAVELRDLFLRPVLADFADAATQALLATFDAGDLALLGDDVDRMSESELLAYLSGT